MTGGPTPTAMSPDEQRRRQRSGLVFATVSAAAFGSSGPMGRALIDAGWTAGSAVFVRLGGAAVLLGGYLALRQRHLLRLTRHTARILVIYGLVAMAGVQFAFFNAVQTLDVGIALLLEYLAPVLLLLWTSLRVRRLPAGPTLLGAALSLIGLVLVLDLRGEVSVDPVGVGWGLLAAVCLAGYFAMSARQEETLPPVVMAAGGTAVGAAALGLAGLVGLIPMSFSTATTELAGSDVAWWVPALWLVVITSTTAYLTGIAGVVRLGSRTASFVSLSEVLFGVLTAWVLLAQLPGLVQLIGGVAILTGIVLVQRSELLTGPDPVG